MLIPGNTNGAGDLESLSDCLLASELACCSSLLCRRWASRAIWYSFREAEEPVFSTIFRSWEWGFCRRWYGLSISFSWPLLTTWGLGGGRWREEGGGRRELYVVMLLTTEHGWIMQCSTRQLPSQPYSYEMAQKFKSADKHDWGDSLSMLQPTNAKIYKQ